METDDTLARCQRRQAWLDKLSRIRQARRRKWMLILVTAAYFARPIKPNEA